MISILALVLGGLLGLYVSHRAIVEPLWGVERDLREELRKLRGELWARGIEISNLRTWIGLNRFQVQSTPESMAVPHRTHSNVLKINSIDDLIEGTKP
ncbi:hypothetical protein LCGC14_1932730 [marine sediment metagenome]|uniref:Uncharacterized protein n=1 Tax=marine sediment metagenome TaxID=412755 RepID=A0A0F9I1B6_9ZZZZ